MSTAHTGGTFVTVANILALIFWLLDALNALGSVVSLGQVGATKSRGAQGNSGQNI